MPEADGEVVAGRASACMIEVAVMVVPDSRPRTTTFSPTVNCDLCAGFRLLPKVVCGVMVTVSVVPSFSVSVQVSAFSAAMVPITPCPRPIPLPAFAELDAGADGDAAELEPPDEPHALAPATTATASPAVPMTSVILRRREEVADSVESIEFVMAATVLGAAVSFLRARWQYLQDLL